MFYEEDTASNCSVAAVYISESLNSPQSSCMIQEQYKYVSSNKNLYYFND